MKDFQKTWGTIAKELLFLIEKKSDSLESKPKKKEMGGSKLYITVHLSGYD